MSVTASIMRLASGGRNRSLLAMTTTFAYVTTMNKVMSLPCLFRCNRDKEVEERETDERLGKNGGHNSEDNSRSGSVQGEPKEKSPEEGRRSRKEGGKKTLEKAVALCYAVSSVQANERKSV